MARIKKEDNSVDLIDSGIDNLFTDLKKAINSQIPGSAFILGDDDSPTDVNEFISSGSFQLDTLISNRADKGGFPVGRISEVSGLEASGKSLIAIEACKDTQKKGGIVIYIDTENATSIDFLINMGVDPKKLVYVHVPTTEEVFQTMESVIDHIVQRYKGKKQKPIILVVWDSLAQTSTQAEMEGGYGDMQFASQAKVIGKGIRKICQYLGESNVCFLVLNQIKFKVGMVFGDPMTTPGGTAIKYAASVRVQLTQSKKIEGETAAGKAIIGFETTAEVKKNKVGPPKRKCHFDIYFNRGVTDERGVLELLKKFDLIHKESAQKGALILEGGEIGEEFKDTATEDSSKQWSKIYAENKEYIERKIRENLVMDLNNPEMVESRTEVNDFIDNEGNEYDTETGQKVKKEKKKKYSEEEEMPGTLAIGLKEY